MNLYLNYAKRHLMLPDEADPVGIILCSEKDDAVVEYAIGDTEALEFTECDALQSQPRRFAAACVRLAILSSVLRSERAISEWHNRSTTISLMSNSLNWSHANSSVRTAQRTNSVSSPATCFCQHRGCWSSFCQPPIPRCIADRSNSWMPLAFPNSSSSDPLTQAISSEVRRFFWQGFARNGARITGHHARLQMPVRLRRDPASTMR